MSRAASISRMIPSRPITDEPERVRSSMTWVTVSPYAARPEGVTARADCVERYERKIELATGPFGGCVLLRLAEVRTRVVETLSRQITRLDDVVPVRANRSLPSLW